MKDIFEKCMAYSRADEYREMDLFPYFRELQSRQDTEVIMEGKRRIMLGSNNYLGLTVNPEIIRTADADRRSQCFPAVSYRASRVACTA